MSHTCFFQWLISEKKMTKRAAKDVISRYKRVCFMLKTDNVSLSSINELKNSVDFAQKSIFVKSQLKRSVKLMVEFEEK